VEAPAEGVIRLLAGEGQTLAVETALAEIGAKGQERAAHVASPAARRLAAERGVDLSSVAGSGPGGRIIARDLEHLAPARPAGGLREAVIASITASWQQIPHIHIGGELAADGLAEAKRRAAADVT